MTYAEGGFDSSDARRYKFFESEVNWEAFISGKPGMEERNRGIAEEAYRRLGIEEDEPDG